MVHGQWAAVTSLRQKQRGASLVEYALLIAMISLFLLGTIKVTFGGSENGFNVVIKKL